MKTTTIYFTYKKILLLLKSNSSKDNALSNRNNNSSLLTPFLFAYNKTDYKKYFLLTALTLHVIMIYTLYGNYGSDNKCLHVHYYYVLNSILFYNVVNI